MEYTSKVCSIYSAFQPPDAGERDRKDVPQTVQSANPWIQQGGWYRLMKKKLIKRGRRNREMVGNGPPYEADKGRRDRHKRFRVHTLVCVPCGRLAIDGVIDSRRDNRG
jgi:hypothetical protein